MNSTEIANNTREDYALLLQEFGAHFTRRGPYLQVGEYGQKPAWILETGVIENQLDDFIPKLVALLLQENVSFAIPINRLVAEKISSAELGYSETGKLVIVYPESTSVACTLARKMIDCTQGFRSPDIPTDSWLGGSVYTRFDTFEKGARALIPFQMPIGQKWPFAIIAKPERSPLGKIILKKKYRLEKLVKANSKGDAFKAVYHKGFFKLGTCFIKQGRRNTFMDKPGRDIYDRLRWQYQLHTALKGMQGIPEALDLFEEDRCLYLVTEWIEGTALGHAMEMIGARMQEDRVSIDIKLYWIGWLQQILELVAVLHAKGYIHRDITPANFIVTDRNIYMIDLELAWNMESSKPAPAFTLGTKGFMSPAQEANLVPCIQDDIYSLGALFFLFFSGITPAHLDTADQAKKQETIEYLVGDKGMAEIITACLQPEAQSRPTLKELQDALSLFRQTLGIVNHSSSVSSNIDNQLKILVKNSIAAFNGSIPCNKKGIWSSKMRMEQQKHVRGRHDVNTVHPGWADGVAGILYTMARLKQAGILLEKDVPAWQQNSEYLREQLLNPISIPSGGLYTGKAGIAMAISAGLRSGLLATNEGWEDHIVDLLDQPTEGITLAAGAAGQGLALLNCLPYISAKKATVLGVKYIKAIVEYPEFINGNLDITGFAHGWAGVTYFLWCWLKKFEDAKVKRAAEWGMLCMQKRACIENGEYTWFIDSYKKVRSMWQANGASGILLCYLKAWQVSETVSYKEMAEKALATFPGVTRSPILDYELGIAGVGDMYLEAWQVLQNDIYRQNAEDIARLLMYTSKDIKMGEVGWGMPNGEVLTGELLYGNAGCLYFLARYNTSEAIPHMYSPSDQI